MVEQEVLKKGRRALLIAGSAHLLRGIHVSDRVDELNAASRLAQRAPELLFVIDPLILPPDPPQDALTCRVQASVARCCMGPPAFTVRQPTALADCERLAEPTSCGAQP